MYKGRDMWPVSVEFWNVKLIQMLQFGQGHELSVSWLTPKECSMCVKYYRKRQIDKKKKKKIKKQINNRFETKRYQPNTVLGQVKLFSGVRVIFFNREVAVSVVSSIKHCDHSGWNPQHSHHWNNSMSNVQSF